MAESVSVLKATEWHADNILEKCWHLLDEETEKILQSEHFKRIPLRTLLQRDTIWVAEACKGNNMEPSAANRRQMLVDALFLVRFPLLTAEQLADGPTTRSADGCRELLNIFVYHNAAVKPELPFPTEQRNTVPMAMGLNRNEAVFARWGSRGIWELAKIIERRQSVVDIRWARDGRKDSVCVKRVVLVSDIQLTNQSITNAANFSTYYPGAVLRV
ncbi:BTB/POZ domain-containing protein 6-B-like [Paramacrobiotus metropolitanus]|uniref:BTB/POZ domain-containing protein 6-B-like n=1 Tax=Paramacrobiotus metropolitanus TaxID=2943436 RepID=UPI002445B164|nr:BTB/POZ domain-containing protein 6-B-like [Paramacrobiotus metropolitanus]